MTKPKPKALCATAAVILLSACSSKPAATVDTPARSARPAAAATPTAAAANDAISPGQTVSGTVLETMDASNYTYVRVKAGSRELWAAASRFNVAVGDKVAISLDQPMENFHSQTLNRDFPLIYFVSRIAPEGAAAVPPLAVAHGEAQSAPSSARPDVGAVPAPAGNATSVADVWKTRVALAGKTVTVRGKVVKYNGGILGVNWIHLQDGTGKASDGSNDITITSETDAKVGDVITATGIVAIDKDLGSGYQYKVIIEHASVAHQ